MPRLAHPEVPEKERHPVHPEGVSQKIANGAPERFPIDRRVEGEELILAHSGSSGPILGLERIQHAAKARRAVDCGQLNFATFGV